MWTRISVPPFHVEGATARVIRFHAGVGERLAPGTTLVDLTVDLGAGVIRDCPPISTCRIVVQEAGWLRAVLARPDDLLRTGDPLVLLSDEPDAASAVPVREARVSVASMLQHADWWTYGA